MTIYIDHQFHYESENLVRLFFPNDKITVVHEIPEEKSLPYIVSTIKTDDKETYISVMLRTEDFFSEDERTLTNEKEDFEKTVEREMDVCL